MSAKAAAAGWKYLLGHKPNDGNGHKPAAPRKKKVQSVDLANRNAAILADLKRKLDTLDRIKELLRDESAS